MRVFEAQFPSSSFRRLKQRLRARSDESVDQAFQTLPIFLHLPFDVTAIAG
jgi:hypothetical protein